MTVSDLSPADEDTVGSGLKGLEDMEGIDSAGTREFDHPHIVGVLQPHGTGHIRGCVSAKGTQHRDDLIATILGSKSG